MVAVGLADLKTVFPATNTSAPAAKMEGAFSSVTPPSISIKQVLFFWRISSFKGLYFF
jgi:hypothetical protein